METDKKGSKILLVDDDVFLLDVYSLKFTNKGYEVITAHDGADALKQIKDGLVVDIILLDVVMPQMDGMQFLEQLRKEKMLPNALVVVLSNQGQVSDIEKAESLGIDGYIIKATTIPSEVVTEVEKILHKKEESK